MECTSKPQGIGLVTIRQWIASNPLTILGIMAALTGLAGAIELVSRRRRRRELRRLAAQWRMNYSPRDRLRVAARLAGRFPVAGAADVHVTDLIYGSEGDQYCYIFTAEYSVGVVRGKRRCVSIAGFTEHKSRQQPACGPVTLAPADLPLLDQYQRLRPASRTE